MQTYEAHIHKVVYDNNSDRNQHYEHKHFSGT